MPFTLVDGSVALGLQALDSLEALLKKGQSVANAASLPEARIHPDMLDLIFQVHFSTDLIVKLHARASGIEPMPLEKDLKTFDDFFTRIDKVRAVVSKFEKDVINSRADTVITVGLGPSKTLSLPVGAYVTAYALPNIFFHLTTAYNILRKNNVDLGKMDFLTPFMGDYMHQVKG